MLSKSLFLVVFLLPRAEAQSVSFTANPNPVVVPAGATTGSTTLTYNASAYPNAQIRIGSEHGSVPTSNSFTDGSLLYLVDANTGKDLDALVINLINPILSANPNPIVVSAGTTGVTTITYNAHGYPKAQVRSGSPTGPVVACCEQGSVVTGDWVTNGMNFYLVDGATGHILQTLTANLQSGPNTLTASPNPILVPFGSTEGVATVTYKAPGYQNAEVRIGSPSGSELTCCENSSVRTGKWVTSGMKFYLVDGGTGTVLQTLTANVQSAPVTLSGTISSNTPVLAGISVRVSGSTATGNNFSEKTQTDSMGNYTFLVPAGGSYTVQPILPGPMLSSTAAVFNEVTENQTTTFIASARTIGPAPPASPPVPDEETDDYKLRSLLLKIDASNYDPVVSLPAIPELKAAFNKNTTDELMRERVASVLMILGQKDDAYWVILSRRAQAAVDNKAPYPLVFDANGKNIRGEISPQFSEWVKTNHLSLNDALGEQMGTLPVELSMLAQTGDPRGLPLFRRGLSSQSYTVRAMAAFGLAVLRDKDSIPAIIDAARKTPAEAQWMVAKALLAFDDPRAQAAAEQLSPNKEILAESKKVLRAKGTRGLF